MATEARCIRACVNSGPITSRFPRHWPNHRGTCSNVHCAVYLFWVAELPTQSEASKTPQLNCLPFRGGGGAGAPRDRNKNIFVLWPNLTVSQAAIFHFSFWLGPGISYEMSLELVYGSDFRCVLHLFSSLTRLKGFWGHLWPTTDPKQQNIKQK